MSINGDKEYHIIYKTTRPSTGEYYIGKHSTNNLEDGYQGSGTRLLRVLKKEECTTEVLHYCRNEEEAYKLEGEIVDLGRLSDPLCLNLMVGGYGFYSGEKNPMFGVTGMTGEKNPMFGKTHSEETIIKIRKSKLGEGHPKFKGYYHTPFGVFTSSYKAAEAANCSQSFILNRVKNDNFPDYWLEPSA